jgi:hypothetical protein
MNLFNLEKDGMQKCARGNVLSVQLGSLSRLRLGPYMLVMFLTKLNGIVRVGQGMFQVGLALRTTTVQLTVARPGLCLSWSRRRWRYGSTPVAYTTGVQPKGVHGLPSISPFTVGTKTRPGAVDQRQPPRSCLSHAVGQARAATTPNLETQGRPTGYGHVV